MSRTIQLFAPLLGRILIGGFFLWNGIEQALDLGGASAIFTRAHFPLPLYFAIAAMGVEVLGGLALIIGFKAREAAGLLALYLLLVSTFLVNAASPAQLQLFLENMAVIGGLLYVVADEKRTRQ